MTPDKQREVFDTFNKEQKQMFIEFTVELFKKLSQDIKEQLDLAEQELMIAEKEAKIKYEIN